MTDKMGSYTANFLGSSARASRREHPGASVLFEARGRGPLCVYIETTSWGLLQIWIQAAPEDKTVASYLSDAFERGDGAALISDASGLRRAQPSQYISGT